jgi:hypothetical protein
MFHGWAASDFAEKGVSALGHKLFANVDLWSRAFTWDESDKAYKFGWVIYDYANEGTTYGPSFNVSILDRGLIRDPKNGQIVGFLQAGRTPDLLRKWLDGAHADIELYVKGERTGLFSAPVDCHVEAKLPSGHTFRYTTDMISWEAATRLVAKIRHAQVLGSTTLDLEFFYHADHHWEMVGFSAPEA